jgi:hypothetical protein
LPQLEADCFTDFTKCQHDSVSSLPAVRRLGSVHPERQLLVVVSLDYVLDSN